MHLDRSRVVFLSLSKDALQLRRRVARVASSMITDGFGRDIIASLGTKGVDPVEVLARAASRLGNNDDDGERRPARCDQARASRFAPPQTAQDGMQAQPRPATRRRTVTPTTAPRTPARSRAARGPARRAARARLGLAAAGAAQTAKAWRAPTTTVMARAPAAAGTATATMTRRQTTPQCTTARTLIAVPQSMPATGAWLMGEQRLARCWSTPSMRSVPRGARAARLSHLPSGQMPSVERQPRVSVNPTSCSVPRATRLPHLRGPQRRSRCLLAPPQ